jgi:hypothetical protein
MCRWGGRKLWITIESTRYNQEKKKEAEVQDEAVQWCGTETQHEVVLQRMKMGREKDQDDKDAHIERS